MQNENRKVIIYFYFNTSLTEKLPKFYKSLILELYLLRKLLLINKLFYSVFSILTY